MALDGLLRQHLSRLIAQYRHTQSLKPLNRTSRTSFVRKIGPEDVALAQFARQSLPYYEKDDGPLTYSQKKAIKRLQLSGRMKVTASLF